MWGVTHTVWDVLLAAMNVLQVVALAYIAAKYHTGGSRTRK